MSDAATGAASAPSAGGHSLAGSKLPEPVAKFISIIGDKKMMADTLEEVRAACEAQMIPEGGR